MKYIQFAAWAAIAAINYATLTHVGFVYSIYFRLSPFLMKPEIRTYARFEHIVAFAFFGALFAFAYPRRLVLVCGVVIFGVGNGLLTWARFYLEPVEAGGPDIDQTIRRTLGTEVQR
jgi:hypothetical protein